MTISIGLTGSRGVLGSRIRESGERRGHVVHQFPGDVRDAAAVTRWLNKTTLDWVVHAAAIVPVLTVKADVSAAIAVNVGGSANLAEACSRSGTRLAYISTSHVYAPSPAPLSETDAVAPSTLYGLTKLQGEQWSCALADTPLILRLFSYFDPRQHSAYLVPGLIGRIAACPPGGTVEVSGANNVRDIADARWLADIIVGLLEANADGVFNCGTGHGSTVAEIAQAALDASGRADAVLEFVEDDRPNSLVARTDLLATVLPHRPEFALGAALRAFWAEAD